MDESPVIELQGIGKRYGAVRALSDVSLSIYPGEIFGFLGPNGAGKTTAIRILTGFIKPSEGTARVFGYDCWRDSVEIKRRLGFLPDVPGIYGGMSGEEFLRYLGSLHGEPHPALRDELLERLELGPAALRRRVKEYSRGMKQKLMIVQAMQHDPDLLIMDEPSEGLDPLMQQAFFSLLRDFQARGRTIFFSSHILPEVEELCQRVAIIRAGRLVAVSPVQELQRGVVRRMEVEFRGPPPAELRVEGVTVEGRDGNRWRLAVVGDVNPIVRELGRYELEDLVFEQPGLEDVFLGFYSEKPAAEVAHD